MSSPTPEVAYYRGQRLEDMSKDALVEAMKDMGRLLSDAHDRNLRNIKSLSSFRTQQPDPPVMSDRELGDAFCEAMGRG